MEGLQFVILSVLMGTAFSYPSTTSQNQPASLSSPQAPIHGTQNQKIQDSSVIGVPLDTPDTAVTNHYPYQASPSNSYHHQPYSANNYGNRDVYNSNRDGSGWSYPYFGVSAGMDYLFSAYIGPVVWAIIGLTATFGLAVALSRILGMDIFSGILQRSKDASARALDLDNVTNMVYQALETYGKYAAKQARDQDTHGVKG